jgi:cysteine desulfurase
VTLALDGEGLVPADSWENIDWSRVGLATSLLAHNETGVIQDLAPLREKCLEFGIPWHVDAVQAAGKIDLSFRQLGATVMSVGAHKFHGPRGIGALLLKRGVPLTPRWFGGHQERDLRPGTEAVALASGMALALTLWQRDKVDRQQRMSALRDRLQAGLLQACEPAVVNGSLRNRLPNTLSMAFPGCEADALLVALDLEQVCCSHGSACSSGSQEPAPILGAMGLPEEIQRSTLRFSVSFQTTDAEIDEGIRRIGKVVARIRQLTSGSEHALRTKREAR